MRTTTILNEMGDTTIAWTPDRDDEMAEIIAKKMAAGVTFFIIEDEGARQQLAADGAAAVKAATADRQRRRLAVPDEDFLRFVESGAGVEMNTPAVPRGRTRVSRKAKEVAENHSVGVRQRRGG